MNILFECLAGDAGGGVFMSITYQDIALILCQNKSEVKEVNHIIFLNDCIMTMPFFVRRASGVEGIINIMTGLCFSQDTCR